VVRPRGLGHAELQRAAHHLALVRERADDGDADGIAQRGHDGREADGVAPGFEEDLHSLFDMHRTIGRS